jgi:hypothetical protein
MRVPTAIDNDRGQDGAPERRIMILELRHAAQAVERAWLISRGSELEHDLVRLVEATRATLDLVVKEPILTTSIARPHVG